MLVFKSASPWFLPYFRRLAGRVMNIHRRKNKPDLAMRNTNTIPCQGIERDYEPINKQPSSTTNKLEK